MSPSGFPYLHGARGLSSTSLETPDQKDIQLQVYKEMHRHRRFADQGYKNKGLF